MAENFGGNLHTISDDEGNEYVLEHLDTIEIDGVYYLAFVPADIEPEDERYGYILMKSETGSDGEDYLVPIDGDEEEMVYEKFMEELFSDEEQ